MSLPPPSLPPPQPAPTPAPGPPPAAPTTGMSGCAKAAIVAGVVVAVIGAGILVLGFVGARWLAGKAEDALGTKPCPYLSDRDAAAVLGGGAKAQQLGSVLQGTLAVALDNRALADAPSCLVTGPAVATARVARSGGGSARFKAERRRADPQTEDRGGGLTVTREGYFGGNVEHLGDEAFCTTSDLTGAVGVLVRKGDTLVYASVQPATFDQSQLVLDPASGAVTNPTACDEAQQLARRVIG